MLYPQPNFPKSHRCSGHGVGLKSNSSVTMATKYLSTRLARGLGHRLERRLNHLTDLRKPRPRLNWENMRVPYMVDLPRRWFMRENPMKNPMKTDDLGIL